MGELDSEVHTSGTSMGEITETLYLKQNPLATIQAGHIRSHIWNNLLIPFFWEFEHTLGYWNKSAIKTSQHSKMEVLLFKPCKSQKWVCRCILSETRGNEKETALMVRMIRVCPLLLLKVDNELLEDGMSRRSQILSDSNTAKQNLDIWYVYKYYMIYWYWYIYILCILDSRPKKHRYWICRGLENAALGLWLCHALLCLCSKTDPRKPQKN